MTLYYLTWDTDASLIVDVATREIALEAGRQTVGSEPAKCVAYPPGTFAVRAYFEDEDDFGTEMISIEALEHVLPVLQLLEDEGTDEHGVTLAPPPDVAPPAPPVAALELACCPVGVDEHERELVCELERPHEPPHRHGAYEW